MTINCHITGAYPQTTAQILQETACWQSQPKWQPDPVQPVQPVASDITFDAPQHHLDGNVMLETFGLALLGLLVLFLAVNRAIYSLTRMNGCQAQRVGDMTNGKFRTPKVRSAIRDFFFDEGYSHYDTRHFTLRGTIVIVSVFCLLTLVIRALFGISG